MGVLLNEQDRLWNSELHRTGSTTEARPHVYCRYLGPRLRHVSGLILSMFLFFSALREVGRHSVSGNTAGIEPVSLRGSASNWRHRMSQKATLAGTL